MKQLLMLTTLLLLLCSCGEDERPDVPDTDTPTDRTVIFALGGTNAATRIPFAENTPVKIYIWQYTAKGVDFTAEPLKTVWGTMAPKDEKYSTVLLTGGDLTDEGKLTVQSGIRYAFVAMIDATPGATVNDIVMAPNGQMAVTHGRFLLAAKQAVTVDNTPEPVTVKFTENGATDGIIPHIQCAVSVKMAFAKMLIDDIVSQELTPVITMRNMSFIDCMPNGGKLLFEKIGEDNPFDFNPDTYITINYNCEKTLTIDDNILVTDYYYILPYPSREGNGKNPLDIEFRFDVSGLSYSILLKGIDLPAFKGGHRYTLVLEVDEDDPQVSPSLSRLTGTLKVVHESPFWINHDWGNDMGT